MSLEKIEAHWLHAFEEVFSRCAIKQDESVVVLAEQRSRVSLIQLTELALGRLNANFYRLVLPTPAHVTGPLIRSSGASDALDSQVAATSALCSADVIIDLTVEGLMHSAQTAKILVSGARIMTISNEHPEILSRLIPNDHLKSRARNDVANLKAATNMLVTSDAGTELNVDMRQARTIGVWGWTDRPGTLAHWPGGIVVSFPAANTVNGQIVLAPGDINLTFKRYIESPVTLTIENDHITDIAGVGADKVLMQDYLASFGERAAYATSHVGWGLNPDARYEALTMYDSDDTNGTELRAVAGNFLYSTGANEFAQRFTKGHFDLPMMHCSISLDGKSVIDNGLLL